MYLSLINGTIGFKVEGIHEILDTDIAISQEMYGRFFIEQSQGKQFRIKNINAATFEEIFEAYTPAPVALPPTEVDVLKEQLAAANEKLVSQDERLRLMEADAMAFQDYVLSTIGGV